MSTFDEYCRISPVSFDWKISNLDNHIWQVNYDIWSRKPRNTSIKLRSDQEKEKIHSWTSSSAACYCADQSESEVKHETDSDNVTIMRRQSENLIHSSQAAFGFIPVNLNLILSTVPGGNQQSCSRNTKQEPDLGSMRLVRPLP